MLDRINAPNRIIPAAGSIRRAHGRSSGDSRPGFFNQLTGLQSRYLDGGENGQFTRTVNGTARVIDQSRTGTPRQVQPGRCYEFDGSADFVDTGTLEGSATFSVSAWVYPTGDSNSRPAGNRETGAGWFLQIDGGNLLFRVDDGGGLTNVQSSISLNQWSHIAATHDGATARLYINGVMVGSASVGAQAVSSETLTWGETDAGFYAGSMFDMRASTAVFTAAEIVEMAAMGLGSTSVGPLPNVCWYKGDEGAGSLAYDSSGSGNHGTITAASLSTFHNETTNDVYSFQNEVAASTFVKAVADETANTWESYLLLEKPLSGDFELEWMYDAQASMSNRAMVGVAESAGAQATSNYEEAVVSYHVQSSSVVARAGAAVQTTLSESYASGSAYRLARVGSDYLFYINDVLKHTYSAAPTTVYPAVFSPGNNAYAPLVFIDAPTRNSRLMTAEAFVVPRDESALTQDVLGNTLQYSGQTPRDAIVSSPCGTAQNTEYVESPHLVGSETVVSHGGTATPTVSAGRITFTAGTVFDLVLSNGDTYPACEGSGGTLHDTANGNTLSLSGVASTATWWAATQNETDTLTTHGYRRSGSVNIPALQDGSDGLAADGNPLTHGPGFLAPGQSLDVSGGEANSPYMQQLAALLADTDYDSGDNSEADALFARVNAGGDDRILTTVPALTGDDLTRMNAYTE